MLYKLYGKAQSMDELMLFIHVVYIEDIQGFDMNMVKAANGQYVSNIFTNAPGEHNVISQRPCVDSMKSRLYLLNGPGRLNPCDDELIIFGSFSKTGLTIKFFNVDIYTAKYLMGGC